MDKANVIRTLTAKKYSFTEKDDQMIVRLVRGISLILYFKDGNLVKVEDMVRRFGRLTNGKSLQRSMKINTIGSLTGVLLVVLWFFLAPDFFSTLGGRVIMIGIVLETLFQYALFLCYYQRLSGVLKLLILGKNR